MQQFSHPRSFDLNSSNAAGCFTGILRRIVSCNKCVYSERDGVELDMIMKQETNVEQMKVGSPGLVARLMGLDAMPVFPCNSPEISSIKRSRSTNSAETLAEFGGEKSHAAQMRKSLSFREAPTYLRKENDDFLLLTFSPKPQSSRRKLSSRFDDANCSSPDFLLGIVSNCGLKTTAHEASKKSSKLEPVRPDCTPFWGKVSMMIEEDARKSTWFSPKTMTNDKE